MIQTDNRHSPNVLSQAELAAIGIVAAESTYLEGLLAFFIHQLLGVSAEIGGLITENMMMGARIDLYSRLAKAKLPARHHPRAGELATLLKAANEKRNFVVHGRWEHEFPNRLAALAGGSSEPWAVGIREKKGVVSKFPASDIELTSRMIADARTELLYFIFDVTPVSSEYADQDAAPAPERGP